MGAATAEIVLQRMDDRTIRRAVVFCQQRDRRHDHAGRAIAALQRADIQKGGLEEIPDIIAELDHYLAPNGTFAMYFSSFVKNGRDMGQTLVADFAQKKGYTAQFWHLGKNVDPTMFDAYRQHGISHLNTWYCLLHKNGQAGLAVMPSSRARSIRDFFYLRIQRWLAA